MGSSIGDAVYDRLARPADARQCTNGPDLAPFAIRAEIVTKGAATEAHLIEL